MTRVCIESPLRGDVALNTLYAEALMFDALKRGEAPFLGHLLYPRVLDDAVQDDRSAGIHAHLVWLSASELVVIGMDLGQPTSGMQEAIDLAAAHNIPVVPRWLGPGWKDQFLQSRRPTKFSAQETDQLAQAVSGLTHAVSVLNRFLPKAVNRLRRERRAASRS